MLREGRPLPYDLVSDTPENPHDIKKGDQRSPLTNNILISSKTALTIVLGNPIVIKIETDYIYPRGRVNLLRSWG